MALLPGTWPGHFHAGDTGLEGILWKTGPACIKGLPEQLAAPVQSLVAPHLVQFYYYSLNSPKMLGFPVNCQLLTEHWASLHFSRVNLPPLAHACSVILALGAEQQLTIYVLWELDSTWLRAFFL